MQNSNKKSTRRIIAYGKLFQERATVSYCPDETHGVLTIKGTTRQVFDFLHGVELAREDARMIAGMEAV